ncbi:MAG: hypothetical protein NVSMB17_16510 [Candidatus Dormibacteria bacterium]
MTGQREEASITNPAWIFDRASGEVALCLLATVIGIGVLPSGAGRGSHWSRPFLAGLHRRLSPMVFAFLLVHFLTALTDPFQAFDIPQLLVPGRASYRALFMGLGAVSLELLLAVTFSSISVRWISRSWWRPVHWLSYPAFFAGWVHAVGAGTDTTQPAFLVVDVFLGCAVLVALAWRLESMLPEPWSLVGYGSGALAVVAAGVWMVHGPLASGWELRERTDSASKSMVGDWWPQNFYDQLTVQPEISADQATGTVVLTIDATGELQLAGTVRGTGSVGTDGHITLTQTEIVLTSPDGATVCSGHGGRLDLDGLEAVCSGRGARVELKAYWAGGGAIRHGFLKGVARPISP